MDAQAFVPFSEGFLLGMGLIVGLGPQNSFILQQGIRKEFVLLIALLASLIDFALIALGVGGAAQFFESMPLVMAVVSWTGVCFLSVYGYKSFRSAFSKEPPNLNVKNVSKAGAKAVIFSILAVSLLNPSTYLDTMFIIGGSAAKYSSSLKLFFAVGAAFASLIWFFLLAFGAAKLSHWLKSPMVARSIDMLSAGIMWLIAGRLVMHLF